MAVTVKVICDSISDYGVRLTTLQLRYPRMIHSDFMSHRVFSRNGRSSRAVPFATLVKEEPYVPHFMKNQPGMVASEEFTESELWIAEGIWLDAAEACQRAAKELAELGVHKQWVNRMLEWFGYIDVLVTSTDWANFFELRLDGGAQPEIIELASVMKDAIDNSRPHKLLPGEWHLPYIDQNHDPLEVSNWMMDNGVYTTPTYEDILPYLQKISVARCARLTIKPFDGDASIEKELKRYELLMESRPVHASPAEHIATPDIKSTYCGPDEWGRSTVVEQGYANPHLHGNFYGWMQFRKMIPHNTIYDR